MICPVCGEPVRHKMSKCIKCGYEFKSLIIATNEHKDNSDEHDDDTLYKEIDSRNIKMGRQPQGGGSIFDELFGGSVFGSHGFGGGLFGGFSSIIDDLFGGIFGSAQEYDDDEFDGESQYVDEFGNPIPIDVFDREFVEVEEIEEYDSDGNLKSKKDKKDSKGFFRRKKHNDDKAKN